MDDKVITGFNNRGLVIVEIFNFFYAYCEYCVHHNMV